MFGSDGIVASGLMHVEGNGIRRGNSTKLPVEEKREERQMKKVRCSPRDKSTRTRERRKRRRTTMMIAMRSRVQLVSQEDDHGDDGDDDDDSKGLKAQMMSSVSISSAFLSLTAITPNTTAVTAMLVLPGVASLSRSVHFLLSRKKKPPLLACPWG